MKPTEKEPEKIEDHPFPDEELNLLMKIRKSNILTEDERKLLSDLIIKYLDLRAFVFHDF